MKKLLFGAVLVATQFGLVDAAWAWGPAVHTAIACNILDNLALILPSVGSVIQSFPLEYLYGSLAADFFVGKGQKPKKGHSHNWESGFRMLEEARDDREAAYGHGFLCHLAADVIAHNYYVPNLIHRHSKWKRMGHLYWEAKADNWVGRIYTRIAKELLNMEELSCDDLLKAAVGKGRNGLRAKRRFLVQTIRMSEYITSSQPAVLLTKNSRYQVSDEYVGFMVYLSSRLARDILNHPYSSPCLSYDPIGSENLRLASQHAILSRVFDLPRPQYQFVVDDELLML